MRSRGVLAEPAVSYMIFRVRASREEMQAGDQRVFALAEAVADGHDVDWDRAESAAHSPEQLQIVQQLRHLASIGALAQTKSWGPLEIRAEIGHGTFGTVYHAWDTRLERDVALKLLNVERLDDRSVSTVIREGRL